MTTAAKPQTFAEALVAAQNEMPAVERDGKNPHFGSSFVTLGNLLAKVRPVLNKHGIAVTQYPSRDENGPTLVTILIHKSGERMESEAPLLLPKQDPQGQGSAITYMRRYALAAHLGISDQEDDDGNEASKAPAKKTEKPKAATNGAKSTTPPELVQKLVDGIVKTKITWDEQKLMLAAIGVNAPDDKPSTLGAAQALYGTLTAEQAEQALKFVVSDEKAA